MNCKYINVFLKENFDFRDLKILKIPLLNNLSKPK